MSMSGRTSRSALTTLVLIVWGPACRVAPPPPPDLVDAAQVLREMTSRRHLDQAGFFEVHPEAKPSDFVSFINSDLGEVLWPPREDSLFADEIEIEQARATGQTLIPSGIAYTRNRPNPDVKRQIVYRADDEEGEIVVEAYTDPTGEPVFVRRLRLPEVNPETPPS
jgi:hypothetical protein